MLRPKAIMWFERLYLASTGITVAAVLFNYGTLREQAIERGGSPAGPILGMIIALAGGLLFWFTVGRRASNIAKWILVVLTALGTLTLPWAWGEVVGVGALYAVLNVVAYLLGIAACACLFQPEASAWLRSKGRNGPVNPDIFS